MDDFSLLSLRFPEDLAWNRRPLTYLSYWLNFAITGAEPAAFRLTSIVLHTLGVQLCFSALTRLLGASRAFWVALIFAMHPMQAEAVLYVFARPVVLMGVLLWWALDRWLAGRHWQAVGIGALALFAKEEAIAFPLVLAALHFSISRNRAEWRPLGASLLAALVMGLVSVVTTATVAGSGAGARAGVRALPYLATQPASLARYLWHAVVPYPILFDAAPPLLPSVWALAWLVPVGLLLWQRHRFAQAGAAFWGCAALLFLLPTSSIFPLADLSAYRRMYLPIACLAAALLPRRGEVWISAALAAATIFYAHLWQDPQRLWRMTYERTSTLRPALELARLLPTEEARGVIESRRGLGESNPDFHTELGRIAMSERNAAQALRHFGKALALDPERASHYYNRGAALLALGQRDAARSDFERTLAIDPQHEPAQRAIRAK